MYITIYDHIYDICPIPSTSSCTILDLIGLKTRTRSWSWPGSGNGPR